MPRSEGRTIWRTMFSTWAIYWSLTSKARAAGHLDVDHKLSGIGARKVCAAQEREEAAQDHCDAREDHDGGEAGPDEHPPGQSLIALQHALEVFVELCDQPLEEGNLPGLALLRPSPAS